MKIRNLFISALLALFAISCGNDPEVVEADTPAAGEGAPLFQDPGADNLQGGVNTAPGQPNLDVAEHKIVAEEVMNTDKYTYVRAKENGQEIWVATSKQEVKLGNTYVFKGGLLKHNFESKEFNRNFETLYLVSDFRAEGTASSVAANPHGNVQGGSTVEAPTNVVAAAGTIKIADLVANLAKYKGKTVKVTGKVMKVNNMIMGRNWVHLQDGSGKNLDLTLTTTELAKLGETITMEGVLAVDKDFGAGYKYEYIVEGAIKK
ncbi:MAG: SH3-like domain-containing protein [Saprospiraceae bacterium]|nr:SH3-like domain-containing protein [Saprospiraceae bacterium]